MIDMCYPHPAPAAQKYKSTITVSNMILPFLSLCPLVLC